MTIETRSYIEGAEKLFYLVTDPVATRYLHKLNPTAEDLYGLYAPGKPRIESYKEMAEAILRPARQGSRVVAAFYGHPGVFVYPSHHAIKQARSEGIRARMLPAPSAEDCLVADLGLDPGMGCQTFEATSFLARRASIDPTCMVILWQIGVIGDLLYSPDHPDRAAGLKILVEYLDQFYEEEQQVIVYEAAVYPVCEPRIEYVPLRELPQVEVSGISTLCIPPAKSTRYDDEMIDRLGMNRDFLGQAAVSLQARRSSITAQG
jgi:uncharacterized protein YabN with tetrapyrrole methylase and pyrophosphatase domain